MEQFIISSVETLKIFCHHLFSLTNCVKHNYIQFIFIENWEKLQILVKETESLHHLWVFFNKSWFDFSADPNFRLSFLHYRRKNCPISKIHSWIFGVVEAAVIKLKDTSALSEAGVEAGPAAGVRSSSRQPARLWHWLRRMKLPSGRWSSGGWWNKDHRRGV